MDSLGDLLKKKADQIDLDNKLSELDIVQSELDRNFDGRVRAKKISKDGVLFVSTHSAPLANDVRMRQVALIDAINSHKEIKIESIRIWIR